MPKFVQAYIVFMILHRMNDLIVSLAKFVIVYKKPDMDEVKFYDVS